MLKTLILLIVGCVVGVAGSLIVVHQMAPTPNSAAAVPATFEPKTLSYYKAHPAEAKTRFDYCIEHGISPFSNSPETRDCEVAREAYMAKR
ncbi:hypothetical protein [Burkholderia stagnalis]